MPLVLFFPEMSKNSLKILRVPAHRLISAETYLFHLKQDEINYFFQRVHFRFISYRNVSWEEAATMFTKHCSSLGSPFYRP